MRIWRLFTVVMLVAVLASVVGLGVSAKPTQACACLDVNIVAPDRFPVGSPFAVCAIIWNHCDCNADNVKATIHLPAGLELVWPEKDIMYGRIWANTVLAYGWLVRTDVPGDYCVTVTAVGQAACLGTVYGSEEHQITIWDWHVGL